MKEIFKDVKGYNGVYKISNLGRIKSFQKNKVSFIKGSLAGKGYQTVTLCNDKQKRYYVHRLVSETFIPNALNKPQVNHKNGIKTDNRVSNLEWCTAKENINHAIANGLNSVSGESNGFSKLTSEDVIKIRKSYFKGFLTQKYLSKKYNVSQSNIHKIVNFKSFKNE